MKKIKWIAMGAALLLSIGFTAFKPCATCVYATQYRWDGANFVEVFGRYGYDYLCLDDPDVCTYYKPNPATQPNYYIACRYGSYWVDLSVSPSKQLPPR